MEKIIGIDDVIPVKVRQDRMYVSEESLRNRRYCNNIDEAQRILGDGVSLEVVWCGKFEEYAPIKVYLSKKSTCCLLAQDYPKYQI